MNIRTDSFPNVNEIPRLLELQKKMGFEFIQSNGQRMFGPSPECKGSTPPKGSEVFVGKLPRDCFEDELVPFMEKVGKIYGTRLMMDFSGTNRGYAFVMYRNPQDATRAVKELNNTEIRIGRTVGVVKSVDNCRLFIGGVPKNKSKEEIIEAMSKLVDGIKSIILYNSLHDKTKNRGFAFIEFDSHRSAAMARRRLLYYKPKLWGYEVAVDWAEPELEVDETVMSKVTIF
ncbi:hypothetical protein J437_LFUL001737 [Ladona fulva]|uniref:RRM domain-containing protein n=1 Tax=Ladona fulva TaxID=123851 RepID=A0A8K0K110_LADFU|nr:hypothetical protein J437_LFUL001737 [Ladona fulva]